VRARLRGDAGEVLARGVAGVQVRLGLARVDVHEDRAVPVDRRAQDVVGEPVHLDVESGGERARRPLPVGDDHLLGADDDDDVVLARRDGLPGELDRGRGRGARVLDVHDREPPEPEVAQQHLTADHLLSRQEPGGRIGEVHGLDLAGGGPRIGERAGDGLGDQALQAALSVLAEGGGAAAGYDRRHGGRLEKVGNPIVGGSQARPPATTPRTRFVTCLCQAGPVPGPLPFDPIAEAGRHWEARWGADSAVPMMAVTSVMRVHQLLLARLNDALEPHGLTFARYEALMLLFFSRTGSLPLGKIGTRLQVHPTSVTNLIDGLERSGLATRSAHPNDRRTTLATITERGREVAAASTQTLNGIEFGTAPLTPKELGAITRIVRGVRLEAGDFVD
jgi:DNA-binding MarR family transcriptional regulator